jgi:vesicular inhibitory amino acid transporter
LSKNKVLISAIGYTWKRVAFRSLVVLVLLFVCATMPNFSMFLDLVGGSTITLLTFVFPPFFYMRLVDSSSQNPAWEQRYRCLLKNIL